MSDCQIVNHLFLFTLPFLVSHQFSCWKYTGCCFFLFYLFLFLAISNFFSFFLLGFRLFWYHAWRYVFFVSLIFLSFFCFCFMFTNFISFFLYGLSFHYHSFSHPFFLSPCFIFLLSSSFTIFFPFHFLSSSPSFSFFLSFLSSSSLFSFFFSFSSL